MIYILIVLWASGGKAALAVEFNDVKSCQAAAAQIQSRRGSDFTHLDVIFCAAKGEKR